MVSVSFTLMIEKWFKFRPQSVQLKRCKGILKIVKCRHGYHSIQLFNRSGSVFGWGKNLFGQLGVNDNADRAYPTHLRTLRNIGVRYIACGDDFSVFLTAGGKWADFSCLKTTDFFSSISYKKVKSLAPEPEHTDNWVMVAYKMIIYLEWSLSWWVLFARKYQRDDDTP